MCYQVLERLLLDKLSTVTIVESHGQATFSSCLLISRCVPCWPNLRQGQRVESLWSTPHRSASWVRRQGWEGYRVTSDSGETDGRRLGHLDIPSDWLVLVVRYLWRSQVVGGGRAVLWSQRVWDRITSAHLLTERFSALLNSESPYFLLCYGSKGNAYIRRLRGGSKQKLFQCHLDLERAP